MISSRSKKFLRSMGMMCITIIISSAVENLVPPGNARIFLVPLLSVLPWFPYLVWESIQQRDKSRKEKLELEEKYAAQDAELLKQATKSNPPLINRDAWKPSDIKI